MSQGFDDRVLQWFERCGRRDLPWQIEPTPYRVWVSEIMLQQTQVATVIPYFQHFMERFPQVTDLADADLDEVLHLWSGLGYYARARNMHRAAESIRDHHGGRFPEDFDDVVALPGVGRSTAGAILALSCGQRHSILDGNVKRVLCRHRGIEGWPGRAAVERTLWQLADTLTPWERVGEYTQAMMDLGATVCRRSRPQCDVCPVSDDCVARAEGRQHVLPAPRPARERPLRRTVMLLITDRQDRVLLERRASSGIWGGLWSFPELPEGLGAEQWVKERLGVAVTKSETWPDVSHGFTHFELAITPQRVVLASEPAVVMEAGHWLWYNPGSPKRFGTAAIVTRLLDALLGDNHNRMARGRAG